MVVISLFSGPFCHGDEVAAGVSTRLELTPVTDEAVVEIAAAHGEIPAEKLRRCMRGESSFLNRITREKERCIARLRVACAEVMARDGIVLHGLAGHLLSEPLGHVLRVGLGAPREHRLRQAEASGLGPRAAETRVAEEEARLEAWTSFLHDRSPWDKTLYDLFLPMQAVSVDEAVATVLEYAGQEQFGFDAAARQALRDARRAAEIGVVLTERGHDVDVRFAEGTATIMIRRPTLRPRRLERTLEELARTVEGVDAVEVRPGERYRQPSIYADIGAEAPPRILLVDDEAAFVQSLSERLRGRDIPTTVAYDGEEALARVKETEPEVMVLDLKMPGIDGLEVLRRVKRDNARTEVIILTGHGSDAEERLAFELGAFAYLRKPVDIDHLTRTMSAAYEKLNLARREPAP